MTAACMGGWCRKRDRCPHYLAADRRDPAERLCVPGADGVGAGLPVVMHLPAGSWESRWSGFAAKAGVWDGLATARGASWA